MDTDLRYHHYRLQ